MLHLNVTLPFLSCFVVCVVDTQVLDARDCGLQHRKEMETRKLTIYEAKWTVFMSHKRAFTVNKKR